LACGEKKGRNKKNKVPSSYGGAKIYAFALSFNIIDIKAQL
jgi:hypothetical protein